MFVGGSAHRGYRQRLARLRALFGPGTQPAPWDRRNRLIFQVLAIPSLIVYVAGVALRNPWLFSIGLAVFMGLVTMRSMRKSFVQRSGNACGWTMCPTCMYQLHRDSPTLDEQRVCPECGAASSHRSAVAQWCTAFPTLIDDVKVEGVTD